jgi:hypothetical protein
MTKASWKADEFGAPRAPKRLNVRAAYAHPLDPYSYFAIPWLGNFSVTECQVPWLTKDCNPLRVGVARAH